MIETKNLQAGYQDKVILNDISLTIVPEKITAIIGTNGSGKSTLLKQLGGIEKPKKGQITINGQNIQSLRRKVLAQRVGFLPQQAQAPEGATVKDIVALGRYPHHSMFKQNIKQDLEKIHSALTEVGLLPLLNTQFSALSGGQKQRAWLSMILAQDTDTLLLDEPTTYLDIAHQKQLLELLQKLNRNLNKTIVMVLHDINQVYQYSDYVIVLKEGKIIASGLTKEVVNQETIYQAFDVASQFIPCGNHQRDYIVV
ncbi:ABC transporter ATP-binding protein [Thiotrichales bacterium 19S9-12]|nr:ABC transporter ATP-binding protein [Thiotrichales bacterium 19S9-11]MCF6811776.1 ABC transporter ATP-binding protein [Thiotrichales bacterium 19S9-12]